MVIYPGESKKLFEKYFDSSFKHGNILTEEQYEKASNEFELLYGKFFPVDKNVAVLDIGCGAGHFLYYLKKKGYTNFLGIDISSQQIDFCKKHITEKVELADAFEYLENKDDIYDVVAGHDLLEHMPKDKILPFLELSHKSLKKEGVFIVRVPNMSNPFSLDSRYKDFTHEVGFTAKSLYQVLWIAGFRDITILPPKTIPVRSFKNLIRKILVYLLHKAIRFFYFVQDFMIPLNLDKNLLAISKKT